MAPVALLSARWRVIGFDHRGAGATISSAASISHERMVEDILVVLDGYGIDRCVLAGESAGVGVVISAAARHPERVAGAVLVDGFTSTEPGRDDDPFALSLRTDFAGTIDQFVNDCLPDPDADALRHWGRLILSRSTPEHAIALLAAAVDPRDDLAHVRVPALVIHCDGDRIAPLKDGRALAAGLSNATSATGTARSNEASICIDMPPNLLILRVCVGIPRSTSTWTWCGRPGPRSGPPR